MAVAATLVATLVRIAVAPLVGSSIPFFMYFVATLFVAWYVGWRLALLSILLSVAAGTYLFVTPATTSPFFLTTRSDRVTLLGFLFGTAAATFLFDLQRRTLTRVKQEAMRRKAAQVEIEKSERRYRLLSRTIRTRCGSSIAIRSGSWPLIMPPCSNTATQARSFYG